MKEQSNTYKQLIKATSIFGGVQVVNIIIQIIKSKFIAVLLGPSGMGIHDLLNSTIGFVGAATNFGLGTSAVKDVAEANASGNSKKIATTITVLRRWVWLTGLLGALVVLFASPWLSQLAFDSNKYTLAFIWISVALLFNQLSIGQMVILQGMRKIKYLANANLTGALLGLVASVPFYYFFRLDGIVPAIIVTSFLLSLRGWYFARKVKIDKINVSNKATVTEGKQMLKMGFMLSLSTLITLGIAYILRIYISKTGGISDVGLYTAGFAILNGYVGLVFSAMATDYYPRLAGVAKDNEKSSLLINQQAEIAILILAPILIIFFIYIDWLLIILYSNKFIAINKMIQWASLGIFFRAASWSMGFLFLASGATKLFLKKEIVISVIMLLLNIAGYYLYRFEGLGISFLVSNIINFILVFYLISKNYEFLFNTEFKRIFSITFGFALSCFFLIKILPNPINVIVGSMFFLITSWYSYKELDKRIGIKMILKNYLKK